jgi:hypothetical protein
MPGPRLPRAGCCVAARGTVARYLDQMQSAALRGAGGTTRRRTQFGCRSCLRRMRRSASAPCADVSGRNGLTAEIESDAGSDELPRLMLIAGERLPAIFQPVPCRKRICDRDAEFNVACCTGCQQSRRQDHGEFIDVAPAPVFPNLHGRHDGMVRRTKVLGGVPVLRIVAATHVSTGSAKPQVDPRVAELEAFLAAACVRPVGMHRVQMAASVSHDLRAFGFLDEESTRSSISQRQSQMRAAPRLTEAEARRSAQDGKSGGFAANHGGIRGPDC